MKSAVLPLGILGFLLGACGVDDGLRLVDEPGHREAAIVNGTPHTGHPSVGMLRIDGNSLCTATLVGAKTVITAAHCIGSSHTFVLEGNSYAAASARTHPSWNSYTLANDIAVVILAQAPSVAPSAVATTAPSVGEGITLVGYGVTSDNRNDSGTKRIATNSISQLDSTRFSFAGSDGSNGSTCFGDSGGPAFATVGSLEVQAGVTSAGQTPCGTLGIDTRVDAYVSWISSTAGGDLNTGTTAPPDPPPPPPPVTDQTPPTVKITSPVQGATVSGTFTVSATIQDNVGVAKGELVVDGSPAASLAAPPFSFQVTLAAGSHTLKVNGYDAAGNQGTASASVTVDTGAAPAPTPPAPDDPPAPSTPEPGAFGASCESAADCTSKLCAEDSAASGKYCTQGCNPSTTDCPTGAECFATNKAGQFVCGPPLTPLPAAAAASPGTGLVGGCSVGPASGPADTGLARVLLALVLLLGLRGCRTRRTVG